MSRADTSCVIALAGNPNVGKSTLFNRITGLRQHTGNWPGKTVEIAQGTAKADGSVRVVDLPGAYSLMAHSKEEEVARDFLLFERVDVVVVVCDATCLARNLNLALQALEMGKRCVVCVNLLDEAQRNHISLDLPRLEALLGVPVVGASARGNRGVGELLRRARDCPAPRRAPDIEYPTPIARAVDAVAAHMSAGAWNQRYIALRLLEGDMTFAARVRAQSGLPEAALRQARLERERLRQAGYDEDTWNDALVAAIYRRADAIAAQVVKEAPAARLEWQRAMDRLVTSRRAGIPLMLLLLTLVFFLTIAGANAPSQWLSRHLLSLQGDLLAGLLAWGAPEWLADALANGVYRTLAWVVSVMLPPMAIFFPLFTLLEDLGYLPRVAFNLDGALRRCRACGKQALTMAMGFGCNAVGVMGCRIIDSPRERLVAILTNSLVPCNGRFPLLLLLIAMFFAGNNFVVTAVLLTAAVALGVFATFFASWLLSLTVLRGMPSAFALELPPYRRPQVGKVIVRSVLDRTAFVLGRAAMVAAPAGLLLWLMATARGRREPTTARHSVFRSVCPLDWPGWHAVHGLSIGLSGQRNRVAHRADGLSGRRRAGGNGRCASASRRTPRQWLDAGNRRLHPAVFVDALAVLHHLPDNLPGNALLEVDAAGHFPANGFGLVGLRCHVDAFNKMLPPRVGYGRAAGNCCWR